VGTAPLVIAAPGTNVTFAGTMPNITHAGSLTQPLFEPTGGVAGLVAQWATYPAVANVDMSGNNIDNATTITAETGILSSTLGPGEVTMVDATNISDLKIGKAIINGANNTMDLIYLDASGLGTLSIGQALISSTEPVQAPEFRLPLVGLQSGHIQFTDLSGTHELRSIDGDLYFDNELLAKASDLQNITDWAFYPALAAVDMDGKVLTNAEHVGIDTSGGSNIILSSDASGNLLKDGAPVALVSQIPDLAQWATYPAVAAVDLSGNALLDVSSVEIRGGLLTVTGAGTVLNFNGSPITTGGGGSAANWSTFPAVSTVNLAGNNVTGNGGAIQLTSGTLGATLIDNSEKTYTRLLETGSTATFGAPIQQPYSLTSGSNFMGNPLVIGDTSPVYTGGLTVNGPATLDGGSLHGTSIGCLPVSGINTVRIDALPVGTIDLLAPAAITINAGGAGNFACGGALSLAGGGYIEMNTGEVQMINTTSNQSLLSVNTIQGNSHSGGDGKLYLEKLVSINAGTPGTTVAVSSTLDFDTGPATSITGAKEINATFVTTDRLGSTFSSTIRVEQDLSGNPGVAYRADTLEARTQVSLSGLAPLIVATDPSPIAIELRAGNGIEVKNNVGNFGYLKSGTHSIYDTTAPTQFADVAWDDASQRINVAPSGTGLNSVAYLSDIPRVYGTFSSVNTQTVSAANTPTEITHDTVEVAIGGVDISGAGGIYLPVAGNYLVSVSIQLDKSGGGVSPCDFWLRLNGVDVPRSASQVVVNGTNGETLAAVVSITAATAGQILSVIFASSDNTMAATAFPAWVTPGDPYDRPAIPSIITTVSLLRT